MTQRTRRRRPARLAMGLATLGAIVVIGGVIAWSRLDAARAAAGPAVTASAASIAAASPPVPLATPVPFLDRLAFRIRSSGGTPEFCSGLHLPDLVVLGHIYGCADELILMQPARVDCGDIRGGTTAAGLAAAILARPGLAAKDRGAIRAGDNVPDGMFRSVPIGRVLDLPMKRAFDPQAGDPDGCRLSASIRQGHDEQAATVELRGDLSARYILFDGPGGLVVIGVSIGGHDQRSGAAAHERGYGGGDRGQKQHILGQIYDVAIE